MTLTASSLYRLLAIRIGRGYYVLSCGHLFQDFVNATAQVTLTESDILVRYQKLAHNPLLIAAGYNNADRNARTPPGCSGCSSYSGSLKLSPWNERGGTPKTNAQRNASMSRHIG